LRLGQPDPGRGGHPRARAAVARGAGQPVPARHFPAGLRRRGSARGRRSSEQRPGRVMRERVGSGCIVAVDLAPDAEPLTAAPFGPGPSGWRVLGHRLNPRATSWPAPTVFDILSRSTGLSQVRQQRTALAGDHVDLLRARSSPGSAHWTSKAGPGSSKPATGTPPKRWPDRSWPTGSPAERRHSAPGREACTGCRRRG